MTTGLARLSDNAIRTPMRYRVTINGNVQGVGFRPFVYRLAVARAISGHVMNTVEGVMAEIEGAPGQLDALINDIHNLAPANALIYRIDVRTVTASGQTGFSIRNSSEEGVSGISVPPDLASCAACIDELFTPANRRYRYPFTNCSECGPRYSIIKSMPWDRGRTTMSDFTLCTRCETEYLNPEDRRFHAETNCCPLCGPQLEFIDAAGTLLARNDAALLDTAEAIRRGKIVAIKGPGGYQLFADARNPDAVRLLRERKQRRSKPFAVMFPSMRSIQHVCNVSDTELSIITGRERPIVLLYRSGSTSGIAPQLAPDNPGLGAMLPSTPLQYLLMAELDFPVIATSGNRSDEPIAIDNTEAFSRLSGIADYFLGHDRQVLRPVDDSVVKVVCGRVQVLRRARGYAPLSVVTGPIQAGIVASGGHLKSTVAITQKDRIVLSQHIGDLDSPVGRDNHNTTFHDLIGLHRVTPMGLCCDLHPDYYTTRMAERWAADRGLPLTKVQHHLAHIAAVMAEHGLAAPLLGVAWDGSGFGPDNTLWGGEFILVTDQGWQRVAHLGQFRLPGGSTAIREPRRAAFGLLYGIYGHTLADMDHLAPVASLSPTERRTIMAMMDNNLNTPITSSAGRLFDAVSSLLGLCQVGSYEGEAACRLEWLCATAETNLAYNFDICAANDGTEWLLDWESVILHILSDLADGVAIATVAAAFHRGLASAISDMAHKFGVQTVALTGGCFQNSMLTELTVQKLQQQGLHVYWNEQVPPGDGGLALGQAYWTAQIRANGDKQ